MLAVARVTRRVNGRRVRALGMICPRARRRRSGARCWLDQELRIAEGRKLTAAVATTHGYPAPMDLARLRGRMPLIVFILLAVVCLAVLGFACACLTDQPVQAIDRAVAAGAALPPLIEMWSLLVVALGGAGVLFVHARRAPSRASPVLLQRFLI